MKYLILESVVVEDRCSSELGYEKAIANQVHEMSDTSYLIEKSSFFPICDTGLIIWLSDKDCRENDRD